LHVTGRNEETAPAVNQQIRRRTDAARKEQRQAGRCSLVDGDTPRLVVREEGEDVGIDVGLRKLALRKVTKNRQAHSEPGCKLDQRCATRTIAGNDEYYGDGGPAGTRQAGPRLDAEHGSHRVLRCPGERLVNVALPDGVPSKLASHATTRI